MGPRYCARLGKPVNEDAGVDEAGVMTVTGLAHPRAGRPDDARVREVEATWWGGGAVWQEGQPGGGAASRRGEVVGRRRGVVGGPTGRGRGVAAGRSGGAAARCGRRANRAEARRRGRAN